jgi:hypothetical protein
MRRKWWRFNRGDLVSSAVQRDYFWLAEWYEGVGDRVQAEFGLIVDCHAPGPFNDGPRYSVLLNDKVYLVRQERMKPFEEGEKTT